MPKGYNEKAIAGLLTFLEGCFEVVLQEVRKGKSPEEAMVEELEEIRRILVRDKANTDVSFEAYRRRGP